MRAERLGVSSDHLFVVSETSLEKILQDIQKLSPSTVVVDSIQDPWFTQLLTGMEEELQSRDINDDYLGGGYAVVGDAEQIAEG